MTLNLADLHRSRLETLLAVEVEYQKKLLALSNQRIQAIKKLLTDTEGLHQDMEGDELLASTSTDPSPPQISSVEPSKKGSKKKQSKKSAPPTKPVKLAAGKVPRLIDALQMIIRNKRMGAKEAYALLKAKNWLPKSKDPLGYIRFTLSDGSDIFHRVEGERGIYELDSSNPYYSGKSQSVKASKEDESEETQEVSETSSKPTTENLNTEDDVEDPPVMSDSDSHEVVEAILNGDIPVDG